MAHYLVFLYHLPGSRRRFIPAPALARKRSIQELQT